jgi:hypothetical protein
MKIRCPNPLCKKSINCSIYDIEKQMHCETCGARFSTDFHLIDFIDKRVNLFTVLGVFIAIITILPTISDGGYIFQKNVTHIFYHPPVDTLSFGLTCLANLFIIACSMMVLFLGTAILNDLFGGSRYRELIFFEIGKYTFRKEDPARWVFAFPFIILLLTLTFSIIIRSGDIWWLYLCSFSIFEGLILFLIYVSTRETPNMKNQS